MKQYNGWNYITVKTMVGWWKWLVWTPRALSKPKLLYVLLLNLQNWICSTLSCTLRVNFRRCLHVEITSVCLFSIAMCGLVIRKNVSVLQRLQRFVRFVYGFAFAMIFHVSVNSLFSFFSFHRCLLSSVWFLSLRAWMTSSGFGILP